jgi:hypothetical protein
MSSNFGDAAEIRKMVRTEKGLNWLKSFINYEKINWLGDKTFERYSKE